MSGRTSPFAGVALFALLTLLLLAGPAPAYVGPGVGPDFFGYFVSLLAWVGIAFSALLLWPVYALIRRFRGTPSKAPPPAAADAPAGPADGSAPPPG
jgi:hypothetical protein